MRRNARRRSATIGVAILALLALTMAPAVGQTDGYGGPGGPPPGLPPGPPASPPSAVPTPPARDRVADVDLELANPGDPVTFTTEGIFDPGSSVDVVLVRGRQGANGTVVAEPTVDADGSVSTTFTVPADAQPGVYFVYAEGVDPDGNPIRATAAIVVLAEGQTRAGDPPPIQPGTAQASNAEGGDAEASGDSGSVAPPAGVQSLQLTADGEQAVLDAVDAAGASASLFIDGDRVSVTDGDDSTSTAPMTAGIAAGVLVLAGAVFLRSRRTRRA